LNFMSAPLERMDTPRTERAYPVAVGYRSPGTPAQIRTSAHYPTFPIWNQNWRILLLLHSP